MKDGSSASRRRLAPPWALAAFGAAMLLLIVFLFPRASVFQQLGGGNDPDRADSVRVLLLRELLAKGGKGFALRRDYVRQLGLTGDYAGAFAELDHVGAETGGAIGDSLWMLEVEVASWALSAKVPEKSARARLRAAGDSLLRAGSPGHQAWAAGKVGDAGEFALAAQLYLRTAAADADPVRWFRHAAAMSAAAGDCGGTSAAWFQVYDRLPMGKDRKAAFLEAIRALQACGRLDEALAAADGRIGEWKGDTDVLLFLVHLAQSADRPHAAQRYAQLLVKPLADGAKP
jgi:hypothetical protein